MLLVEDEPHAAQVPAKGLREQSHAVDVAGGEAAIFQAGTCDYDAVILDLLLKRRASVESLIEGLDCVPLVSWRRPQRICPIGITTPIANLEDPFARSLWLLSMLQKDVPRRRSAIARLLPQ
jgi:CheY-like chemotaxis protein